MSVSAKNNQQKNNHKSYSTNTRYYWYLNAQFECFVFVQLFYVTIYCTIYTDMSLTNFTEAGINQEKSVETRLDEGWGL